MIRQRRCVFRLIMLALGACGSPFQQEEDHAIFVLREVGCHPLPTTTVSGTTVYRLHAETLYAAIPRSAAGTGVLRLSVAAGYSPDPVTLRHTRHSFSWQGDRLSVFFACPIDVLCLAIYGPAAGELRGRNLTFVGVHTSIPALRYERIR